MEVLKGYIDHFVYQSEKTDYVVFMLATSDGSHTCVGNVSGYGIGENVEVTGEFVIHPVYDKQLKISEIRALPPEDRVAIERYLGSGAIKGLGEALAKRVVNMFGDDTFRIAQEEPERLAEVKGISLKKAYEIGAQLAEKRDIRDAMIFLQKYGISQNLANKIYKQYGVSLYQVMEENPYRLAEDIKGVGFKIADDIAMKSGLTVESRFRIRSAILYTMSQTAIDGHCYYPENKLKIKTAELLGTELEDIDEYLLDLIADRKLVVKTEDDERRVYLPTYYFSEIDISERLCELLISFNGPATLIAKNSWYEKIDEVARKQQFELDPLQKQAVCECMLNGVFVLSGGPGTGKTTTLNTILQVFEQENIEFLLGAPTGRAAKRMQESTGYEAKTIHRLLEIAGSIDEEGTRSVRFERNEENPLEADAIIIDEMSMVDVHLFRSLLKAILPGTRLILVGDSNQLPSVGAGQVLADILESHIFPQVRLEKVFRQDAESHIITNAYRINAGESIDFTEKYKDFFLLEKDNAETICWYITELITKNIPNSLKIAPLDVQILTPMRKGSLGTQGLNTLLQNNLNPKTPKKKEYIFGDNLLREGDKVMQIKNDYDTQWEIIGRYNIPVDKGTGIYNGDIGIIKEIHEYTREMVIVFDDNKTVNYPFDNLENLELAYAMTVHKSQGGEYPVIIMPLLSGPQVLFTRNLLYTGVTRAKECVILIGSSATVNEMIKNDMIVERYTTLLKRLKEGMEKYTFEDI